MCVCVSGDGVKVWVGKCVCVGVRACMHVLNVCSMPVSVHGTLFFMHFLSLLLQLVEEDCGNPCVASQNGGQ